MMNRVCILLLFAFLSVQNGRSDAQQVKTSSFKDSLPFLLDYFYANTGDNIFKEALQKSKVLYAAGVISDSLAKQLVYTEKLLLRLLKDSVLLNRHPFSPEINLAFGNTIANMLQAVPPQNENPYYAAALNNLGILYVEKEDVTAADQEKKLDLFKEALEMRKKVLGVENEDYAESQFNVAEAEGNYPVMLQAMAISKKSGGGENWEYAGKLYSLATLCKEMKRYDTARLLYEQGTTLKKKIGGGENANYALQLYEAGELIMYLWDYQKALFYYTQALNMTRKTLGEENIQYAYCLEGLAGYYYTIAAYKEAVPLYLQSLAIKEKIYGKNYSDIALTLHNLTTTYIKMANYDQAIPCLRRALTICKKSPSTLPGNYAYELNWLALLYQKIGNDDKALSLYKQALDIPEYKDQRLRYAATLSNMADLYARLNENKQALLCLEQARLLTKELTGARSPDYANNLYNIATLYEKLNRHETAMQLCRETLLIRKKVLGEAHPQYALSLCLLGSIYMDMKKADSARSYFAEALEIQKKALTQEHPDYIKTLNSLAMAQAADNNTEAAFTIAKANRLELAYVARTYTSLSEQEKIELENDQSHQFSYLPSLIYKSNKQRAPLLQQLYINELVLKGMVLNDQQSLLHSIRKSNDSMAIGLYNEWRVNKIFIGKQLSQPKEERLYDLDSIIGVTNQLEEQISNISVPFRQQHEMPSLKNISDKLRQNEAAIEFIKFQLYNSKWTDSVMYGALVLRAGNSTPAFIPLFEEKQLTNVLSKSGKNENAVNRFYGLTDNAKQSAGNSLYLLMWKPLEKYLAGVNTIYYAPVGLLHRIAFKALPVDASHFLIDKYSLNQMLSTRAVASQEGPLQKPFAVNIWGDINYDLKKDNTDSHLYATVQRGPDEDLYENTNDLNIYDTADFRSFRWPFLYGARMEIDSIEKIFINAGIKVIATTGSSATEEVFRMLDGNSPQLLHIATHGFFWGAKDKLNSRFILQQDPMFRSGLVLAGANEIWDPQRQFTGKDDGILTSYEIANLDLGNTDIVILSSCETALGDLQDNEGVIGLQRAFKIAGVKQMILSLWKVPDKETVELMTMFYKNLIDGQSAAESLRIAQLKMKEKYPPYYWAAFVLIE